MADALDRARREAGTYFKNPEVYLERYFHDPRHVEFQVLGDRHGRLVHLGERDCSVQRRHQKLIEETPCPAVDRELRATMGEMALRVAAGVGYASAGTVEFLLTEDENFYFLEMNTRIQVEHPITEAVTGTDLIREMVLAAAGESIGLCESVLDPNGHAIEIRVNAEDPQAGFRPTPTEITRYHEPGGIGIRIDSGVYAGYAIPQEYDSLMAKLIAWAPERDRARIRTLRALREYRIEGPSSTIPFARAVLDNPVFVDGQAGTQFVASHLGELEEAMRTMDAVPAIGTPGPAVTRGDERTFEVTVDRKRFRVGVAELQSERRDVVRSPRRPRATISSPSNAVTSPMHGTVLTIRKSEGEPVEQGEPLFIVEAMKMENEIPAHRSGTLTGISVQVGQTVESGQMLATIE
jgi:acetyl-CoA/propionyl-CoA carboxylase biotin carboxyl carrier protein